MSLEQPQESRDVAASPPTEHFEEGAEAAPPGVRVMAVVRWLLVLAMGGVALLSLWHTYGHVGHAEERATTQYYCPMHPAVVQDQPGTCPICGMNLVARERPAEPAPPAASSAAGERHEPSDAGHAGHDRGPKPGRKPAPVAAHPPADPPVAASVPGLMTIDLPEPRLQLIGMRTAQVVTGSLPSELKAVGYVAPTESGLAVIQTRFSGWIEELPVAQTGELVQRGQLLARVYSPELLAAQQELLNTLRWSGDASVAHAPNLTQSARARLELMGMAPAEIDQVERSGAPHRLIEIRSPVRGYVAQKSAVQGLYIQPGTRLFDIADLSKVWLLVELFERDAGRIKAGQRATLELTAYPGESFSGKVQLVYPTLDPGTRTQRARIVFANPALRLRPGMFGNALIQLTAATGLLIPREAVVDTGEQQYVFVREGAGRFSPRAVQLGVRFDELVQVRAGLVEGETVVTTGNFLIDSESRLRATIGGVHAGH